MVNLRKSIDPKHYKKTISIKCMISGKSLSPYQVPHTATCECDWKNCKKDDCYIKDNLGRVDINADDPVILKFINSSESVNSSTIKGYMKAPCPGRIGFKINSVYTIEEVYLKPIINQRSETSNLDSDGIYCGYFMGYGLECNNPYELECIPIPEPKTNKVIYLITKAKRLKLSIDEFQTTPEIHKQLKKFQPKTLDYDGIWNKLGELADIYAMNVTKIYDRQDLHIGLDLIFHSPLSFYFDKEYIHKGWGDVLVVGDTRCGKGYVAENLMRYYGVGEAVSGENLSFAGLVGGIQTINKSHIITWGKIPLNNRGLCIIDEAGEMDVKVFSRLSRIRSEGIAEIIKIQSEKTQAKTRLIFLCNPIGRRISSYSFGIESVSDLFEQSEDIARFDYAIVVSNEDVPIERINAARQECDNPYAGIDPILINFIWSRKADQIRFMHKATASILQYAVQLGSIYSPSIPLIQGENIRIKLAKISVMIAGRLYSVKDKDIETIVVEKEHVDAAVSFLNMIYKKKCSSYYDYSQIRIRANTVLEIDKVGRFLKRFGTELQIVDYFISNNCITVTDLSECVNLPKDMSREIVSTLLSHKCLIKKSSYYTKVSGFVEWLKIRHKYLNDEYTKKQVKRK